MHPDANLCFQRVLSLSSVPAGLLIILRPSKNSQRGPTRPFIIWSLLHSTSSSLPQPYHVLFYLFKYTILSLFLQLLLNAFCLGCPLAWYNLPPLPTSPFSLTSTYLPPSWILFLRCALLVPKILPTEEVTSL